MTTFKKSHYPLIIIGGGMTGLSTGLAWQKVKGSAEAPLILEQHRIVGGCVTSYARQGYHFDTTQFIPDISDLLAFYGIDFPLKK